MDLLVVLLMAMAGLVGATLGVGGVLIVPLLTTLCGMPIKSAIGASIVCLAVTASLADVTGRGHDPAAHLALALAPASFVGVIAGSLSAVAISPAALMLVCAAGLLTVAARLEQIAPADANIAQEDCADSSLVSAIAVRAPLGNHLGVALSACLGAAAAGLLGFGGGMLRVAILRKMQLPLRQAIATSNLMVGITASTGAITYYRHDILDIAATAPAVAGVLLGVWLSRWTSVARHRRVCRRLVQPALVVFAGLLIFQALSR